VSVPAAGELEVDEDAIGLAGRLVLDHLPAVNRSPRWLIEERLMHRLSSDPATKAALFRLVDVAPMCRSRRELAEHLNALLGELEQPPKPAIHAKRLAGGRFSGAVVGGVAARAVTTMASRFIVGESVDAATHELGRLWRHGVASTVDLLGEATVTDGEADAYAQRCREALESLTKHSARWREQDLPSGDRHGPIPRANLSIKVSALTPNARPEAPRRGVESARGRLRELLVCARDLGAHLHIDMESLDLRETATELVLELLSEPDFRDGPSAGIVLQAYLRDSVAELDRWLDWAAATPRAKPLTIRLVKGAYWDQEVVEAKEAGWDVPVFEGRAECDRNFEGLTKTLVARADLVRPAIASHNVRSVANAIAAAETAQADDVLELQVLRGLGDDLQSALAGAGLRVRAYCPVGDLVAGMAYLVRRLLENTSNDSFLRIRATATDPAELLVAP
jgi:proline dehydrogenase